MKRLVGLVGFICLSAAIPGAAEAGSVWGLGAGSKNCETWVTAADDLYAVCGSWVLGFWSGLNADAPTDALRNAGQPADNLAILDLVKAECRIHPGETLWVATVTARERAAATAP
jgi:hypothetical protein